MESLSKIEPTQSERMLDKPTSKNEPRTFADFFCGIGGFHVAAAATGLRCVFASDIDRDACETYERNFGVRPHGDIVDICAETVPDHDVLTAGIPCQPFSIIGKRKGFADSRGNLFFELERIIAEKRPRAVVIENVRQFATIDGGKPLACVLTRLKRLDYFVEWRILNALDFGLPQKRERILIVAIRDSNKFNWPEGGVPMNPLSNILESNPDEKYFVSSHIRTARRAAHSASITPSIWHENKGGNVSSHPWSCALRAGASYNYLLVNGERRLTPREMFRLQGFPDDFKMPASVAASRRLTGNSVPIPMIQAVIDCVLDACR